MPEVETSIARVKAQSIDARTPIEQQITYSICTNVTNFSEYGALVESFRSRGFGQDCEFLYVDNSNGNVSDAYDAYNLFLDRARGIYVVLCHQDILLDFDDRDQLDRIIQDINNLDKRWVAIGNAGVDKNGRWALHITDPHGQNRRAGELPTEAISLDENFIVVRRASNIGFSCDIGGFHLYGTDICLLAEMIGGRCYVVDFHLRHNSPGKKSADFEITRTRMIEKYRHAMRKRWLVTPATVLPIRSGWKLPGFLASQRFSVLMKKLHSNRFLRRYLN